MNDLSIRKLTPEILDSIPHDDPGAIRSRRDLARINRFMGNSTWILRSLPASPSHIAEIGAGDGLLLRKIAKAHPNSQIRAYDLAPRPPALPAAIDWICGDLFTQPLPPPGGVLIANLFLHHFTDEQLGRLSHWISGFQTIITCEPFRARFPLFMGKLAHPFIHPITRHDMHVSIEAGFLPGELPAALNLKELGYRIQESASNRGFIRMIANK